jgi:hypothetical protein
MAEEKRVLADPAPEVGRELQERLRRETLIADLSSRFVDVRADLADREIEDAQRRGRDYRSTLVRP